MAHGYLPEYDEAPERSGDRARWRDERDRDWREPVHDERGRDFMLGRQEIGGDLDRFRGEGRREPGESGADDRDFRSSMDHHYRSWRDRHMSEIDRDYADYCREREQRFHSDFDEWRRRRHGSPEPLRTGMTQTGISSDPSGEFQLREDQELTPSVGQDPIATATLGEEGGR